MISKTRAAFKTNSPHAKPALTPSAFSPPFIRNLPRGGFLESAPVSKHPQTSEKNRERVTPTWAKRLISGRKRAWSSLPSARRAPYFHCSQDLPTAGVCEQLWSIHLKSPSLWQQGELITLWGFSLISNFLICFKSVLPGWEQWQRQREHARPTACRDAVVYADLLFVWWSSKEVFLTSQTKTNILPYLLAHSPNHIWKNSTKIAGQYLFYVQNSNHMLSHFSCWAKSGHLWSSRHMGTALLPAAVQNVPGDPAGWPLPSVVEGNEAWGCPPWPGYTGSERKNGDHR